ncbi:hypothetical protein MYCTH_2299152 [Thermothelomyces thermophilus ATCC 42464]|uniref:Transmembrane protein n=1 Tax=Thermothelomyces thermophilus (strain ATCC 42464 / BCRC 31852 / DSM 1799) TaxID=573729 RepID=G2Q4U7_THET4|nr:uncharacterized protein MYCTH_2299152 [Thermothelomyces thermophilus ATCC 42464]AEO55386.1 hypothetical protein MYCTH_2299152 [Thermothelomyces thermophilus ATCC 42464]
MGVSSPPLVLLSFVYCFLFLLCAVWLSNLGWTEEKKLDYGCVRGWGTPLDGFKFPNSCGCVAGGV